MGDFRAVCSAAGVTFLACFLVLVVMALFVALLSPEHCSDVHDHDHTHYDPHDPHYYLPVAGTDEPCDFGQSMFLVFTTFVAGSWGHLYPSESQRWAICLVASLGYLWPLMSTGVLLFQMKQKSLLRLAATSLAVWYVTTALVGNLLLSALMLIREDDAVEDVGHEAEPSYGIWLYFAWMTYHLRAFGEVSPHGFVQDLVSLLIVMMGSLCWVLPLFTVARQTVLDPGASLFSSGPNGQFKPLCRRAVQAVALPYGCCVIVLLILAGIYFALCTADECSVTEYIGYGGALHLLWTTFHGATWGHVSPEGGVQQAVACIVASLGYLWRQLVLLLLLRSINQREIARKYTGALLGTYSCFALLGNLILAAVVLAVDMNSVGGSYGTSLYYAWMTYHGRAYGEYAPMSAGGEAIAALLACLGNLGWVWPLLLVVRSSVLATVLSTVVPMESAPQAAQVVGAQFGNDAEA
ncbi:unnamed protein product [Symbiodinium sp. CCMP2592]|nr:unnamed protein product [Symbiodinium sp. CCMP2592]